MPKKDDRLILYEKFTELIFYSKNLLNKYPKCERFDLCTDIKNLIYEGLGNVIRAWKSYSNDEKLMLLRETDVNLLILKSLVKISYQYKYINDKNYMTWDGKISEIGKLVGGWIKVCQKELTTYSTQK